MRYLALESRRAPEMAELIRRQGGEPTIAPAMREVDLDANTGIFHFAERLFAGEFDMVIFMTGVGVRALNRVLATRYPPAAFANALRNVTIVARGPKPVAALRDLDVAVAICVPEPNTWREILAVTEGRPERRVALQEYGRPNVELVEAFRARGVEITPVRVYRWDLPEDVGPLRDAVLRLADGGFDVVLFTTAAQVDHLFRIAHGLGVEDRVRDALARIVVASIGPTTSEMLEEYGVARDFEPSHPKMGYLVKEVSERARSILSRKRN
jgi:uroporphyrinogen-III synthase